MNRHQNKIPLRKALSIILLSVLIISGSPALTLLYFKHIRDKKRHDPTYQIVAIVQACSNGEGLKSVYLAELLNLSVDKPINLYSFNTKEGRQKLLDSPVFREAHIKRIPPGTIHIDYALRRPIAFIADFTNTVIDNHGVIFPFKPFFTPKKLPEIYLGGKWETNIVWGNILQDEKLDLAMSLLHLAANYVCDENTSLRRVDVSNAFAPSYGQRQIVLIFEEKMNRMNEGMPIVYSYPRMLRLSPDNYREQLANYLELSKFLRQQDSKAMPALSMPTAGILKMKATIIDMRLSELAFIETEH